MKTPQIPNLKLDNKRLAFTKEATNSSITGGQPGGVAEDNMKTPLALKPEPNAWDWVNATGPVHKKGGKNGKRGQGKLKRLNLKQSEIRGTSSKKHHGPNGKSSEEHHGTDGKSSKEHHGPNGKSSNEHHSPNGKSSEEHHGTDGKSSKEQHGANGKESKEHHGSNGKSSKEQHGPNGKSSEEHHDVNTTSAEDDARGEK